RRRSGCRGWVLAHGMPKRSRSTSAQAVRSSGPCRVRAWSSPSDSSTRRAGCSSSCTRPLAGGSTAPGARRRASASARPFDFELEAAATDDGILLSLGEQHSFPLAEIFEFLHPDTVEAVLVQAVLQAPLFGTRFRWSATRALALSRYQSGGRVPPHIQRARAEDLLAAVFPRQVACQDNHPGADVDPPDHPLVIH